MRILVLSDVHANLVALEAVLADAGDFDEIWNLGDSVGYGPRPNECLDRLLALPNATTLVGNHDLACIGELDLAAFNPVARQASLWTQRHLTPEHIEALRHLQPMTEVHGFTLAHGSPRAPIWEYITDAASAGVAFEHFSTAVCFVGHTHIAMVARLAPGSSPVTLDYLEAGQTIDLSRSRLIVNPGSVGQPRDRDPRAAYGILDTDRGTFTACRVSYDVQRAYEETVAVGLPESLGTRLRYGI